MHLSDVFESSSNSEVICFKEKFGSNLTNYTLLDIILNSSTCKRMFYHPTISEISLIEKYD